jgi:tetratricopeptide (TPR) repeat protein
LGARLLDVTVLDEQAGVALLDAALRGARPGDDRVQADRRGAMRLAGICGGLPLALQITAALLKADPSQAVRDMVDELADEVRRLEALCYDDGSGTSAPSVAAAFELSYRRLGEVAARVFRLLPVNPGPDVSTAAVAALAALPTGDARTMIGQLVRAHLADTAPSTASRWRMHDLLRLYARQLSDAHADADQREQARDRLLRYYVDTASAADAHLRTLSAAPIPAIFTGRDSALAWLDAERPNLVAAVIMAADSRRDEIAVHLPNVLAEYHDLRRRFDDKVAITALGLEAARRLGDRQNEGVALSILGGTLPQIERFDEAITACQDAAAIFRETGDRHGEGMVMGNLGTVLGGMGRSEEAISACQDAAAIFRETGDRRREGMAMNNLGTYLRNEGRFEEAITACQDAAVIARETGHRQREGMAMNNLAIALGEVGRPEEAITAYRDAAAILRETG